MRKRASSPWVIPFLALGLSGYSIAADSYSVANGTSQYIYEFGACRQVTNNHPSGKALFVPTKTSTEWVVFYGSSISGVTIANDTTAPTCSITGNPADPTTDTDATFSFSGSDTGCGVSYYQCNLDSGGWSTCTTGKYYSGLSVASHNFQVRAHDLAGNVQTTPASYNWTIEPTCANNGQACIGGAGDCCAGLYCDAFGTGLGACQLQKSEFQGPCDADQNPILDNMCESPSTCCWDDSMCTTNLSFCPLP